jgi:NAD(P)-dependent dehydrogenase (short-subunit alcohol dehydrogenase family)
VVSGRDGARGRDVVDLITVDGGTATFVPADVTVDHEVSRLVDTAVSTYGALHGAFNNAGTVSAFGRVEDLSEQAWRSEMDVNLTSVFLSLKHEIPAILASGGGSIVNNSSQLGVVGIAGGVSAYVAAKHGVTGLTRAAALENAAAGVRVNALVLAGVDTRCSAARWAPPLRGPPRSPRSTRSAGSHRPTRSAPSWPSCCPTKPASSPALPSR